MAERAAVLGAVKIIVQQKWIVCQDSSVHYSHLRDVTVYNLETFTNHRFSKTSITLIQNLQKSELVDSHHSRNIVQPLTMLLSHQPLSHLEELPGEVLHMIT